jgi:hypothetical protein
MNMINITLDDREIQALGIIFGKTEVTLEVARILINLQTKIATAWQEEQHKVAVKKEGE